MRSLFGLFCAIVLTVVSLVGCGDDVDGGTGGSGGTAGSGGNGGTDLRTYTLRITEVQEDGESAPLAGVTVCEIGNDICTESNELGTATLRVPANQEVTITMEKEGYGSWVTGDVSDETAELSTTRRMFRHGALEAVATDLEIAYPWEGGIVGLVRYPEPQPGVMFEAVGSTSDAVGESFYWDAEEQRYNLALEATTPLLQNWLAPLGDAGFTEVTPGEQVFELVGDTGNCRASWSWPGSTPGTIRVPVIEGYRTYGSWTCNDQ